ncbi:regulation of nuclear pre-mRNA domain-containing protein 1B isoform X3 [Austrofundulus limnaeus]|uniref:Regulation of nuclear pre-mRNA domain-containing protein 1B isoform X3 n=1 Tax=Austrofundulus limnaeus TaxID=52670 RepID=A0A2I4B0E7_AUSLI|nr:PREDICTED: regulation of nuclear pre-mRNA domain-containing protein 1A isoform X3 [Austrofundulus limnaeus]
MSAFSEAALEKKLSELSNSQQSVQTLSLWLIHHRKHSKTIVSVWFNELRKAQVSRKLTFLYLANDVIQNSKRKGPEFTQDFAPLIVDAFKHVYREGEESCKKQLGRVLSIWQERAVYEQSLLEQLSQVLDKESGERLSRLVEEACMLLADYSGRLAAEIDDRRQLTRTLTVFLQSQKDGLAQNEQKLEVRIEHCSRPFCVRLIHLTLICPQSLACSMKCVENLNSELISHLRKDHFISFSLSSVQCVCTAHTVSKVSV